MIGNKNILANLIIEYFNFKENIIKLLVTNYSYRIGQYQYIIKYENNLLSKICNKLPDTYRKQYSNLIDDEYMDLSSVYRSILQSYLIDVLGYHIDVNDVSQYKSISRDFKLKMVLT